MSDTPARTIAGLKPRAITPDLSRLQRRNRTGQPAETPIPSTPAKTEHEIQPQTRPAKRAKQKAEAGTPQVVTQSTPAPEPPTDKVRTGRLSTYLSIDTLERARATYRATSHLEHDRTFSDFVERAIYAEIVRREAEHNVGERYEADTSRLRPGRPLG